MSGLLPFLTFHCWPAEVTPPPAPGLALPPKIGKYNLITWLGGAAETVSGPYSCLLHFRFILPLYLNTAIHPFQNIFLRVF